MSRQHLPFLPARAARGVSRHMGCGYITFAATKHYNPGKTSSCGYFRQNTDTIV